MTHLMDGHGGPTSTPSPRSRPEPAPSAGPAAAGPLAAPPRGSHRDALLRSLEQTLPHVAPSELRDLADDLSQLTTARVRRTR